MKLELIHDIIARKIWERLPEEDKQLRQLRQLAEQRWHNFAEGRGSYLGKNELAALQPFLGRLEISPEVRSFIAESQARLQRSARRRRLLILALIAVLALAALISAWSALQARRQQRIAEREKRHALANGLAAEAQDELGNGNRSSAFLLASFLLDFVEPTNDGALQTLFSSAYHNNLYPGNRLPWSKVLRHDAPLASAELSADGSRLLTVSSGEAIYLWALPSGRLLQAIPLADAKATKAFFLKGGEVAAVLDDFTIRRWQLASGQPVGAPYHSEVPIHATALAPDGQQLAIGNANGAVVLLGLSTGASRLIHEELFFIRDLAFAPDGSRLAFASVMKAGILSVEGNAPVRYYEGHSGHVERVVFSPGGKALLTCSKDSTLRLWEVESGEVRQTFRGHQAEVRDARFSPDGSTIYSAANDGTIRIWEVQSGFQREVLTGHSSYIHALTSSADGRFLASASNDRTARIWYDEPEPLLKPWAVSAAERPVVGLAISADGQFVAAAAGDSIRISRTGPVGEKSVVSYLLPAVQQLAFSPARSLLAAASENGSITLWEMGEAEPQYKLEIEGGSIKSLAFSPDGSTLAAVTADSRLRLWALSSLSFREAPVALEYPSFLAYSPDGSQLAVAFESGRLFLYGSARLEPVDSFSYEEGLHYLAFSDDGAWLAAAAESGKVVVWNRKENSIYRVLDEHSLPLGGLLFLPGSGRLATAAYDGALLFHDLEKPSPVLSARKAGSRFSSLAAFPAGQQLATGDNYGRVFFWEAGKEGLQQAVENSVNIGPITPAEIAKYDLAEALSQVESWPAFIEKASPGLQASMAAFLLEEARELHQLDAVNGRLERAEALGKNGLSGPDSLAAAHQLGAIYQLWAEKLLEGAAYDEALEKAAMAKSRGAPAPMVACAAHFARGQLEAGVAAALPPFLEGAPILLPVERWKNLPGYRDNADWQAGAELLARLLHLPARDGLDAFARKNFGLQQLRFEPFSFGQLVERYIPEKGQRERFLEAKGDVD